MRILIADDHAILRKGLREILLGEYPSALIAETADSNALTKEAFREQWDLIITDLAMPGRSGLEAVYEIRAHSPQVPILVLSAFSEDLYARRALKAGASGYIDKDAADTELIKAVQRVLLGRKYITPATAEKLADGLKSDKEPHELLTDREFNVMKLIAVGETLLDIAQMLSLSPNTISTYRARLLKKMNLATNADITRYALHYGLI